MVLKVLGNRVLVKIIKNEDKYTDNGILIPDYVVQPTSRGEVVSVGNRLLKDGSTVPLEVKVGNIIHFPKYSRNTLTVEGVDLVLIDEHELLAVE